MTNQNRPTYAGTWTAIITPFTQDDQIDEQALRKIVRRQAEGGVTGIVPVGTTGESPTTTMEEDTRIFEIVCDEVKKIESETGSRPLVMAGTGSNCTRDAVKYTQNALKAGADCCLVVAPYYNKPTPAGLIAHYQAVADVGLPVIVYNIKGRTGINIDTETLMIIAEHKNVVGVKEASGNMVQMKEVIARRPENFAVLSGDDGLTVELIKNGGDGVVSVSSNIVPSQISEMVNFALAGNFEEAEKMNQNFAKMFDELFCETNPVPVKYLAAKMGLCELKYRLPMLPPTAAGQNTLDNLISHYNL
jgi:4-hydroxy-tetrahydrodipicolinate synthase